MHRKMYFEVMQTNLGVHKIKIIPINITHHETNIDLHLISILNCTNLHIV